MIKASPRFSARSMVWSQRSSSTSSSMEKCALDSRTVSRPRAALPQNAVRPGAMRAAENEVGRVSTGPQHDGKSADTVRSGGDLARHSGNGTGDPILRVIADVGEAQHGRPRHTDEP